MGTQTRTALVRSADRRVIHTLGVAVDAHAEGRDATVLGTGIAAAFEAETMLLTVQPDLLLVVPGLDWRAMRNEAAGLLHRTRDDMAPGARTKVAVDFSVARGLKRLVARERCDLLVVGSNRRASEGEVQIGHVTRQLFDQLACPVAIAPRGLSGHGEMNLRRVAVGFDGRPEASAALATAAEIAEGCGAELVVRGVVDDRLPSFGWPQPGIEMFREAWREVMDEEVERLRSSIQSATERLAVPVTVQLRRGRPSHSLLELSGEADLLVIGSRRWGALARLVLGGTGEALVHGARCSLLVVPRPGDRR